MSIMIEFLIYWKKHKKIILKGIEEFNFLMIQTSFQGDRERKFSGNVEYFLFKMKPEQNEIQMKKDGLPLELEKLIKVRVLLIKRSIY